MQAGQQYLFVRWHFTGLIEMCQTPQKHYPLPAVVACLMLQVLFVREGTACAESESVQWQ